MAPLNGLRIAVGSIKQESNTFVPIPTTLDRFGLMLEGDELLTGYKGARVEVPAFLDTLRPAGATIVPLIAAATTPGGPLTPSTFDALLGKLLTRLRAALPLDAVLLALHGAMVVEDDSDAEGTILDAVRTVVGQTIPIAVSVDLHAHMTARMMEHATFIVGFLEYPHTDTYETGVRTAQLLLDMLSGRYRPVMALAKRPMIVSPVSARTTEGTLEGIAAVARAMTESGEVLHAALFPVQPWLDVPELGFGVLVVTDNDPIKAQVAADRLADMVWEERHSFDPDVVPLDYAIRVGLGEAQGLTVVADAGDAPTGGSPADIVAVLRQLLDLGADRAARPSYLTICDPGAARVAAAAGIGHEITIRVGHSVSPGEPLVVSGRVCTLSDGESRLKGPGDTGMRLAMGLTAVLAIGNIRLCIRSLPSSDTDRAVYYSVGLDPRDAALVFVKSPGNFRASFAPLAERVLVADTPGPTRADLRKVEFTRVTRPLYPLDDG